MADEIPLPVGRSGDDAVAVARRCARAAQTIMRDGFGRTGVQAVKGRGNVVTEIDLACERATLEILAAEYPGMAVLSEETASEARSDGWLWVVDPLDGTKNYSRGVPHFCFTIALCHGSEPALGLTLQPILDEEFLAVRGRGFTLNGIPATVAPTGRVRDGIIGVDLGYDAGRGRHQLEMAAHLWPGVEALRIPGSAALGIAYVAAGRWDLFVHLDLEPWDMAAGVLLVQEAGGSASGRGGAAASIFERSLVAGTPAVHRDFFVLAGDLPWR